MRSAYMTWCTRMQHRTMSMTSCDSQYWSWTSLDHNLERGWNSRLGVNPHEMADGHTDAIMDQIRVWALLCTNVCHEG